MSEARIARGAARGRGFISSEVFIRMHYHVIDGPARHRRTAAVSPSRSNGPPPRDSAAKRRRSVKKTDPASTGPRPSGSDPVCRFLP